MMDERAHHPLMKIPPVPVGETATPARRCPDVRFLACGAYRRDLKELSRGPNLWAEISLLEDARTLREAVRIMGPRRVVFGSRSPFLNLRSTLAKLEPAPEDVTADTVEAVRTANALALLNG
jgi:predicted TIM-barrel fold metal-dependent hydrolase